jgi:hypothetical protein
VFIIHAGFRLNKADAIDELHSVSGRKGKKLFLKRFYSGEPNIFFNDPMDKK